MEQMTQEQLEAFISEGEALAPAFEAVLCADLDGIASMNLTPVQKERILMVLDKFTRAVDRAKAVIEKKVK